MRKVLVGHYKLYLISCAPWNIKVCLYGGGKIRINLECNPRAKMTILHGFSFSFNLLKFLSKKFNVTNYAGFKSPHKRL